MHVDTYATAGPGASHAPAGPPLPPGRKRHSRPRSGTATLTALAVGMALWLGTTAPSVSPVTPVTPVTAPPVVIVPTSATVITLQAGGTGP